MKDRNLVYINTALFIILIALAVFFIRTLRFTSAKETKAPARAIVPEETVPGAAIPAYGHKAGTGTDRTLEKKGIPPDLQTLYQDYPEDDVGVNMVKTWANVSPEDKKKFMDGLDNKIESCKEALKVNPYDKKSKNLLAMSESLKKLVSIEFNYKPGAKRPNDKAAR